MASAKQRSQKLEEIESIIEEDCQNGRNIQKRLKKRLTNNGLKPRDFCQRIRNLKSEK